MAARKREFFIDVAPDVRIRCRRDVGPAFRYAVMLEIDEEGTWQTIRLWDNAHGVDLHHEHEYTRWRGKLDPTTRRFESPKVAMGQAIRAAKRDWGADRRRWKEEA